MDLERSVDWHRVFDDFAYLGMTGDELASRIGVRVDQLCHLSSGEHDLEPAAAARSQALWGHLTGKPLEFLPRGPRRERPEVPGIDRPTLQRRVQG